MASRAPRTAAMTSQSRPSQPLFWPITLNRLSPCNQGRRDTTATHRDRPSLLSGSKTECVCERASAQRVISYSLLPACPSLAYLLLSDLVCHDSIFISFSFRFQPAVELFWTQGRTFCTEHRLSVVFLSRFYRSYSTQTEWVGVFVKEFSLSLWSTVLLSLLFPVDHIVAVILHIQQPFSA